AGEAAVPGDVVGVVVGLEHILDPHPVQARQVQVGVDVPLRVDHNCDPGGGVADQVGGAAEVLVDDLSKEHFSIGRFWNRRSATVRSRVAAKEGSGMASEVNTDLEQ